LAEGLTLPLWASILVLLEMFHSLDGQALPAERHSFLSPASLFDAAIVQEEVLVRQAVIASFLFFLT
jgi:hypothetical protein